MKYKWSYQARLLAEKMNLTEAEKEDCEKWIEENIFVIGGQWVLNWLVKNKENN